MRYPDDLKTGDTIGITAPSAGIIKENKILRLENAKKNLKNLGYKCIETDNVRKDEFGRSSDAKTRAKEFMELWNNKDVKAIISAEGGDFMCEMIDNLDFEEIKKLKSTWFQGYSDNTYLSFLLTTICDIATIYGSNIKSYGMQKPGRDLLDSIKLMNGEEIEQKSFEKYEENWLEKIIKGEVSDDEEDPYAGYNLVNKVEWKNLKGEENITIKGRALGGCFDIITNIIGTKYDKISEFIEKYKDDGIVWFLEVFEMSTPQLFCNLWKMKNAEYFKYCNGIVFGRSILLREDYGIDMKKTLLDSLSSLDIPVIYDADIGHLDPTVNIINGSIIEIKSENGKGSVKNYFK